jgi:hypothetical protein
MQHVRQLFFLALVIGWLSPGTASARVTAESGYTKTQNYSAALRFLRVDKGFEVVERDADAAYLIFRYPTPERKEAVATGTIEVVELEQGVTLIVKLPQMPEYHERLLSDQLLKKLREEYGPPQARQRKTKEKSKSKERRRDTDSIDGGASSEPGRK